MHEDRSTGWGSDDGDEISGETQSLVNGFSRVKKVKIRLTLDQAISVWSVLS